MLNSTEEHVQRLPHRVLGDEQGVRALGQVRGMGQRGTGHPAPPGTRCRCGQLEVTEHMLDRTMQAVKGWVLGAVWAAEPRPTPPRRTAPSTSASLTLTKV